MLNLTWNVRYSDICHVSLLNDNVETIQLYVMSEKNGHFEAVTV